jgi:hypothetical protein
MRYSDTQVTPDRVLLLLQQIIRLQTRVFDNGKKSKKGIPPADRAATYLQYFPDPFTSGSYIQPIDDEDANAYGATNASIVTPYAYDSINLWVAALVDLWQYQKQVRVANVKISLLAYIFLRHKTTRSVILAAMQ